MIHNKNHPVIDLNQSEFNFNQVSANVIVGAQVAAKKIFLSKVIFSTSIVVAIALAILFPPYTATLTLSTIFLATYQWVRGIHLRSYCEAMRLNSKIVKDCLVMANQAAILSKNERTLENRENLTTLIGNIEDQVSTYQNYFESNHLSLPNGFDNFKLTMAVCDKVFVSLYYGNEVSGPLPKMTDNEINARSIILEGEITKVISYMSFLLEHQDDEFNRFLHKNKIITLHPEKLEKLKMRKEAHNNLDQYLDLPTKGGEEDFDFIQDLVSS